MLIRRCLDAFRTPAASARGETCHAGVRKPAQLQCTVRAGKSYYRHWLCMMENSCLRGAAAGQFALYRPLGRVDPAHVQPRTSWHETAAMLRNERVESAQEAESSGTDETDPGDPVAAAYADQSSDAGITQEQFNCVRPRPPESDQLRKIPNRLRPLISRVAALTAEKKSARAKWKTEGGAAIHRINQRLPPADNAKHPADNPKHSAKWKGHARLAG